MTAVMSQTERTYIFAPFAITMCAKNAAPIAGDVMNRFVGVVLSNVKSVKNLSARTALVLAPNADVSAIRDAWKMDCV